MVYESDLFVDGKKMNSKDMTIVERFELYILAELYNATEAGSY